MHWLDIVFIVLLAIFGLIGLKKGFLKTILGLFTFVVSLALVVWLAPKVAPIVDGWFDGKLSNFFIERMSNVVQGFGGEYIGSGGTLPSDTSAETIVNTFSIDGIFKALILVIVGAKTILTQGTDVVDYFSTSLGNFIFLAVTALVLYIVVQLILGLLSKLFDKISENRAINGLDRLLGFILGVAKGLLIVGVALIIVRILSFVPGINDFITGTLNDSEWLSKFVNWFYELVDKLIDKIDFNALIKGN